MREQDEELEEELIENIASYEYPTAIPSTHKTMPVVLNNRIMKNANIDIEDEGDQKNLEPFVIALARRTGENLKTTREKLRTTKVKCTDWDKVQSDHTWYMLANQPTIVLPYHKFAIQMQAWNKKKLPTFYLMDYLRTLPNIISSLTAVNASTAGKVLVCVRCKERATVHHLQRCP